MEEDHCFFYFDEYKSAAYSVSSIFFFPNMEEFD